MARDLDGFLVTGAGGMIGRAIPFGRKLTRQNLDVTDLDRIQSVCAELNPTGILHLAAIDLYHCEGDPLNAYRTNSVGAYALAREAAARKIPFVLLSTGAVFSGPPGSRFAEDATQNPVNVYGQSKSIAEILVRETLPDALIVRTGWVFGGHGAHHRKFVDVAIESAFEDRTINAENLKEGSPTYLEDFVAELTRLLQNGATGVAHIVNGGFATGLDIATEIVALVGGGRVNSFTARDEIPRSPSEALVSRENTLRPWREALREYVAGKLAHTK